ncbi:MAG: V-type ATP synthase subunit E [Spirochaetales bacterium]|nr:V-type ATP synthase subunit E [Spirochaetales bacterium]
MEVQIQELIDKIKNEGIDKAEKKADQIEDEARKKAEKIIEDAHKKAEKIIENAKTEAGKFEITGKQAVMQAGRDLILSLRLNIIAIFNALVKKEIKKTFSRDILKEVLVKVINSWIEKGVSDLSVLLSEDDLSSLEEFFSTQFADTLKKGVTIAAAKGIDAGFHISEKDSSAFYDVTDNGIAEALYQYLNPRLASCIEEVIKNRSEV